MRKTDHKLAFALCSALAFAACSGDDAEPVVPETPAAGYHFTFDGSVGTGSNTRAHWSDEAGEKSLIFNWDYTAEEAEANEMMMAFLSPNDWQYLASTNDSYYTYARINEHSVYPEDAHWATFTTTETYEQEMAAYEDYYVIAVTPINNEKNSSSVESTADAFTAVLPMPDAFTQAESQNPAFLRNYMYMYAEGMIMNGSADLSFRHIPATFRFIITNKRPETSTFIRSVAVTAVDEEGYNYPVAAQQATFSANSSDVPSLTFSEEAYNKVETTIDASVEGDATYTAYALALPLAENEAFFGKELQFSITTTDPANTHLAFTLSGETLAAANGNDIYNWVGGKSYTIRMSLADVLTLESISVSDGEDGGYPDGWDNEEELN